MTLGFASEHSNFKIPASLAVQMIMNSPTVRFAAAMAATLLWACEPDDPKVRQEVAELRAKVQELETKAAKARVAATPPPNPARTDILSRETLRRNLDSRMSSLRAALTKAFPEYRVDPVNAATPSTPEDAHYLPYSAEVTFGLSKGQSVASFSIRIGADRAGNWQLPDAEDLAAAVGNLASAGPSPQGSSVTTFSSGRGAMMNNNVRQIEWNDRSAGPPPSADYSAPPAPAAAPAPPQRPPAADAPFPVQDSRTIQFD